MKEKRKDVVAHVYKNLTLSAFKGTLRRRLSHSYFSFIAKYTSN